MLRRLILVLLAFLVLAPAASAVSPEVTIAGPTSKWFSGGLIQQTGLNCSTAILGEPYTEVMVSGIGSYGGAANGGLPRVGQGYWTSLLLSVPGFPCGSGVSAVATEVILPPGTQVDTSRPIRCFGLPRNAADWVELTGGAWNHLGSTGQYCPTQVFPAVYTPGGVSVGFRPIANGQLFQVFVPVVSSNQLVGMGDFNHRFMWTTTATGVYANPGLSSVWANVFAASNVGQGPFVYFEKDPAAVPFWKADAPATPVDLRNRAEFWANFYTAGLAGTVSYVIRRTDTNGVVWDSAPNGGNLPVPAGLDLAQIIPAGDALGPNGGFVPVAFDAATEWNVPMAITWTFTPTVGSPVSATATFRTLAGPDTDGDGVADVQDACPAAKGTLANGCLPAPATDPDGDGIFGAADTCPAAKGNGALDGCPTTAKLGTKVKALFKSAALAKGVTVPVTCSGVAKVTISIVVTKALAKSRLKVTAPKTGLVVATVSGTCTPGATLKLRLVSKKTLRAKLKALKAPLAARLVGKLPAPSPTPKAVAIKLR